MARRFGPNRTIGFRNMRGVPTLMPLQQQIVARHVFELSEFLQSEEHNGIENPYFGIFSQQFLDAMLDVDSVDDARPVLRLLPTNKAYVQNNLVILRRDAQLNYPATPGAIYTGFRNNQLRQVLINTQMTRRRFKIHASYAGAMIARLRPGAGRNNPPIQAALHEMYFNIECHAIDSWTQRDIQALFEYLHLQALIVDKAQYQGVLSRWKAQFDDGRRPDTVPGQEVPGGLLLDRTLEVLTAAGNQRLSFHTKFETRIQADHANIVLNVPHVATLPYDVNNYPQRVDPPHHRIARPRNRYKYNHYHALIEMSKQNSILYRPRGNNDYSLIDHLRNSFAGQRPSGHGNMVKVECIMFRYYTNPHPEAGRLRYSRAARPPGFNIPAGCELLSGRALVQPRGAQITFDTLLGGLRGQCVPQRFASGVGKNSILYIHDFGDNLCVPKALVCLLSYKSRTISPNTWRQFRAAAVCSDPRRKNVRRLTTAALELAQRAGFTIHDFPISIYALHRFCAVLTEGLRKTCHIQVFDSSRNMEIAHATLETGAQVTDFENIEWFDLIMMSDSHVVPALKLHKLLCDQRHFCYRCKKTSFRKEHKCIASCSMCKSSTDHFALWTETKDPAGWLKCDHCTRKFYTQECFRAHLHTCGNRWKCETCGLSFFARTRADGSVNSMVEAIDRKDHRCHTIFCHNCKLYEAVNHRCYMQPREPKEANEKYLYADFEATQNTGEHVINLAITIDHEGNEWPLHYSVEEWLEYLLRPQWQGYTVIFHNGKGYDFHFILNALLKRPGNKHRINPVMVGRKILYFTLATKKRFTLKSGYRFVDSLNFLPMALKKFTKTFNLVTKKGYYPHFFNTAQNMAYVGAIPDPQAFGYDNMSFDEQHKFMEWYDERKMTPWNNCKEIVDYCRADVQLLREGCITFRELVMQSTPHRHDPFQRMTLASSAVDIFRTSFLQENSVAALTAATIRELHPCLAGGRTGCTKMFRRARPGEKMYYVDFTSAYPFVCKNGIYPHGYPDILPEDTSLNLLSQGASIWKVDVDPPQTHLYHPLLHSKDPVSGRLLFDLRSKKEYMYTNFELLKAQELGYTITKVHKVWHWPNTVQGIFKDYINIFLKIKQEAAGWPSKDMSDEDKKRYLRDYKAREGIELNASNIGDTRNSGRYAVAKLYLNSLWGKFGQRLSEEFSRTEIIHSTEEGLRKMYRLLENDSVKEMEAINEYSAVMTCKIPSAPDHKVDGDKNIALAIFTTAHARLKLYNELLEPLGNRICYYDTDSAIFCAQDSEMAELAARVPLGPYLGDITNELGNNPYTYEGTHIVLFASGGPKNYGYVTSDSQSSAKIKGHSLKSNRVSSFMGFNAITDAVLFQAIYKVDYQLIKRDMGFVLRSTPQSKVYRVCFVKRVLHHKLRDDKGKLYCIDTRPYLQGEQVEDLNKEPEDIPVYFNKSGQTEYKDVYGVGIDTLNRPHLLPVHADKQLLLWVENISATQAREVLNHISAFRCPISGLSDMCHSGKLSDCRIINVGTKYREHFLIDDEFIQVIFIQ